MRPLLHLLSIVLVLPSVLLASAFIILGRAIAARSLLGVLGQLLADALWLIPWGLIAACIVILLIAAGGFYVQTRRLAGFCVALLGVGSTVVVLTFTVSHSNFSVGQLPFFVPAGVASCIGFWFAVIERPRNQDAVSAA